MCKIQEPSERNKNYKPKYEMQDIFKLYGDDYILSDELLNWAGKFDIWNSFLNFKP